MVRTNIYNDMRFNNIIILTCERMNILNEKNDLLGHFVNLMIVYQFIEKTKREQVMFSFSFYAVFNVSGGLGSIPKDLIQSIEPSIK